MNINSHQSAPTFGCVKSKDGLKKSTFYEAKQLSGHKRTRDSIIRSAAAPRVLRSGKVFDNRRCSALKQLSNLAIKEEEGTEEEEIETDENDWKEEREENDLKEVEEENDRKEEREENDRKEVEEENDRKEVEEENDRKEEREENDRKEEREENDRKEVEEENDRKEVKEENDRKEEREENDRKEEREENDRKEEREENDRKEKREEMDWTEERCEEYQENRNEEMGRRKGGCTNVEDTEQKEGKGEDVDTMKLNEDAIEMGIFLSDCVSFRRNNRSNAKKVKQKAKKNDSRPKKKVNAIEVSSSPPSTFLESQSPAKVSCKPNPSVDHQAKCVHWADEKENTALSSVKEFHEKPRRRCTMFYKIND
uniref:Uncharacterized protein n=1 Tax=Globodera rostochiensis TaxID=31243 RepID=A0A914HDS5_GLORO